MTQPPQSGRLAPPAGEASRAAGRSGTGPSAPAGSSDNGGFQFDTVSTGRPARLVR